MNIIKNSFGKLNNKIENIKEWKWIAICLIAIVCIFIIISPQILWQPFIYAEDAGIFLTAAMDNGIKSIGETFGGYISIVPRINSLIALFVGEKYNSIVAVTYVMKSSAIIFTAVCINYFNTKQFKWIVKSRIARFIISCIMLFTMANQDFMLYNSTYSHWWGGLLTFFVGLNILVKKVPPLYIMPFIVLSILSSPSAILIAIPVFIYIVGEIVYNLGEVTIKDYLSTHKLDIIKLILISIALLIQAYAILFLQSDVPAIYTPQISLELFISIIKSMINIATYSLTFRAGVYLPETVNLIIGIIIWGMLIYVYATGNSKNKKILIWSAVTIALLYMMSEFKDSRLYELPYYWMTWYNSIPATIIMFLVVNALIRYIKFNKIGITLMITTFWVVGFIYAKRPDYSYCVNIFDVESKIDFSSNKTIEVQNAGGKPGILWLPIKEE